MSERKRASEEFKSIWKKYEKAIRIYLASALCVIVVFLFASLISLTLPVVPLDVSTKVLENVIRLDGVLFGFTAVMLSLVYREMKSYSKEFLYVTSFSITSFLCYLLSIFTAFVSLMFQHRSSLIFVPVILACFGGVCSSIYITMIIIGIEKKE